MASQQARKLEINTNRTATVNDARWHAANGAMRLPEATDESGAHIPPSDLLESRIGISVAKMSVLFQPVQFAGQLC